MTRGEFKLLPKNTPLFIVSWSANGLTILQGQKRAEKDSFDLAIDLVAKYVSVKPTFAACDFTVGIVFKTFSEALAQVVIYHKDPPQNWPISAMQTTLFVGG